MKSGMVRAGLPGHQCGHPKPLVREQARACISGVGVFTFWHQAAFHKLPPMEEFVSARLTRELEARSTSEQKADRIFAHMLERR